MPGINIAQYAVTIASIAVSVILFLFSKKRLFSAAYTAVPLAVAAGAVAAIVFSNTAILLWGILAALAAMCFLLTTGSRSPAADTVAENQTAPDEEQAKEGDQALKLTELLQSFSHHIKDTFEDEIKLSNLLDYITQEMVTFFKADGGAIFLVDEFDDVINVKSAIGEFTPCYKLPPDLPHKQIRIQTNFKYAQFPFGETIFGETVVSGKPCFIPDGTQDPRIYRNEPEEFLIPGSYIVLPLCVENTVIGIMAFSRKADKSPFTQTDFEMSTTAAKFAGIAINNVYAFQEVIEQEAIKTELTIAGNIQKSLQPQKLPELSNLSFGTFFMPVKGICGDYIDVIPVRKDRICLAVGDIAGKGMQAANLMLMICAILRLISNSAKDAATILDWINKGITDRVDIDHYASLALLFLNMEEHTMEYASASHLPLLIWRKATGTVEQCYEKTDPLGVERGTVYQKLKLTIDSGDIIILYTDGIVEALNREGQQYSIDRLAELITLNNNESARDISAKVKQDIKDFCGAENQHDDQSLLVVKVTA